MPACEELGYLGYPGFPGYPGWSRSGLGSKTKTVLVVGLMSVGQEARPSCGPGEPVAEICFR